MLGAGLASLLSAVAGGFLVVTMGIEVFDSNWSPTYVPRDPREGPWLPERTKATDGG